MVLKQKFREVIIIFVVNLIYSLVYMALCFESEHWNGMDIEDSPSVLDKLFNRLYFSVVTFSTVGYGDITPVSRMARAVVITQVLFNITGMVRLLLGM